jgi:hypothetical protein
MVGRRTETIYYTPEQVRQHLEDACEIAKGFGFEPTEHERLVVALFDALRNKNVMIEAVQAGGLGVALPKGL